MGDPGFLAQRAEWLIATGVIGALLAAMAGILDLLAIPGGTRAFGTAPAWAAFIILLPAALPGLTTLPRWILAYRDRRTPAAASGPGAAAASN